MPKADGPLSVDCETADGRTGSTIAPESISGTFWVNFLGVPFWGIIGFGVDLVTGAYQEYPNHVAVSIEGAKTTSSSASTGSVGLPHEGNQEAMASQSAGTSFESDPFAPSEPSQQMEPQSSDPFSESQTGSPPSVNNAMAPPPLDDETTGTVWGGATSEPASPSSSMADSGTAPIAPPAPAADPFPSMQAEAAPTMPPSADPFPSSRTMAPAPTPQQATAPVGRYSVQVGAYSVSANAEQAADRLSGLGLSARIEQQGRLNLVRFGRFANRADARRALRDYKTQAGGDGIVVVN